MVDEKTYPLDQQIEKAQNALATKLGLQPGDVTIQVGNSEREAIAFRGPVLSQDEDKTHVIISIHKPGIDLHRTEEEKAVRTSLKNVPSMANLAQWELTETITEQLVKKIKGTIDGTDFNQDLLKWRPFDPLVAKDGREFDDFAVSGVRDSGYGIDFAVVIPRGEKEGWKEEAEKTAKQMRDRLPEIREILTDRLAKYYEANLTKDSKSKDEIAQAITTLKEEMAKLEISVNSSDYEGLKISLRSPDQEAAFKLAPAEWKEPDNADALKANNPLQRIITRERTEDNKHPQLHKALSRSLLYDKAKKPAPYFTAIAGSHDIMVAIAKEFYRIKQTSPDRTAKFDEIIGSPLFKEHDNWVADPNKPNNAPPEVKITKPLGKNDTLQISFGIKQEEFPKMIEALNTPAVTAPAPAVTTVTGNTNDQPATTLQVVAGQNLAMGQTMTASSPAIPETNMSPPIQLGAVLPPNAQKAAMLQAINKVVEANAPTAGKC